MHNNKYKDGFLDNLWTHYLDMIQNFSNPVFLNYGHNILFTPYKGIINFSLHLFKYFYRNIRYSSNYNLDSSKYLLLCSSTKNNVEPLYNELFEKLNKNSSTATYINFSSQKIYLKRYLIKSFIHSFVLSVKLMFISYKYKKFKFKFKFFHVFINIFYGVHYKYIAKLIINSVKPKTIIVNSERNANISTILNLLKNSDIHTYYICNELPGSHLYPIISKKIFFWDEIHLTQVLDRSKFSTGYIIGNYELQNSSLKNQSEINLFFKNFEQNKYVLFLDDYDGNPIRDKYKFTIKYNQFMYDICKQNPNIYFIFKNRQYVQNVVPGQDQINILPNTIIYNDEVDLSMFLGWNKLMAVGGVSSQGLYVASKLNIPTFRLFFEDIQKPIPVIDQNVQLINNQIQLSEFLKHQTSIFRSNEYSKIENISQKIIKIVSQ